MTATPEERKQHMREYAKQRYTLLKDKLGYNRFETRQAGVYILKSSFTPTLFVGASTCVQGRFATHRNHTIPRLLDIHAPAPTWTYECVLDLTPHKFSVKELNAFEWLYLMYLQHRKTPIANSYNIRYDENKHSLLVCLYPLLDTNAQAVVRSWADALNFIL